MNREERKSKSSLKSAKWLAGGLKGPDTKIKKEKPGVSVTFTDEEMDMLKQYYKEDSDEHHAERDKPISYMSSKVQLQLKEKRISQKAAAQARADSSDSPYKTTEASGFDDEVISPRNDFDYDSNEFFDFGQRRSFDKNQKSKADEDPLSLQSSAQIMKEQAWAHIHEQNSESNYTNSNNFRSTYSKGIGSSEPHRKISVGRKRILNIIEQSAKPEERGKLFNDKPVQELNTSYTAQQFRNYLIQQNLDVPAVLDNIPY
ncbi:hypothetical protein TVAG_429430 [Trichomonas vaginalis G3]|uniref:Uncharacterized protein n=1 Tax=Trichomonas vaginalis (strain ATCC PRA-98 / G3) TaxID=412133 RepID=A2FC50_TRIV3|nr:hypothetical protein TVAGG3_0646320 [Trichomonas vaginalis G3]EAX97507.1 hypothetical protein TVAG_429430 [Trichomonas vaginalis G3]KAI5505529.1 hypothetical protein TVAGG3_0646320 [Trichomonas vaginalis G3]|eukprot:XP_001310437.1 hypothetical protein [Trichomonas vaginalis G3]